MDFTLPASATVASIFAPASDLMGTLWPFIAVAIAIPLTFYLISRVKQLIPGR
jgi:hypothetical protein